MQFIARSLILIAVLTGGPPILRADVMVSSTLNLNLQISASGYSVVFLSPFIASAFAQAQDSLGSADANFESQPDAIAAASATAFLASAQASADAPNKKAGASSFINIPEMNAAANSTAQGTLQGYFQIVGDPGSVSVQFSAALSGNQDLTTTGGGVLGTSELIFNLILPDLLDPTVLFMDSPLQVGPNQNLSNVVGNTLTSSVFLDANTPYLLIAEVDSESSGINVPELSSLWLLATLMSLVFLFRRYRANSRRGPVA